MFPCFRPSLPEIQTPRGSLRNKLRGKASPCGSNDGAPKAQQEALPFFKSYSGQYRSVSELSCAMSRRCVVLCCSNDDVMAHTTGICCGAGLGACGACGPRP